MGKDVLIALGQQRLRHQAVADQRTAHGSINLDLGAEPASEMPLEPVPESVVTPAEEQAVVHDANWEEVNTKLDLAKAYEDMGDLEGARELLEEVLVDGPPDLVAQAESVLGRIGR